MNTRNLLSQLKIEEMQVFIIKNEDKQENPFSHLKEM